MTNEHSRRDLLRSAGTASASIAIIPLESSRTTAERTSTSDNEIPHDISITNNGTEQKVVSITVDSSDGERPFAERYRLQGVNNPDRQREDRVKFKGTVDASASGEFIVEASLPDGSTDSTTVRVTEDGFAYDQAVDVYVRPNGSIVADTII